MLISVGDAMLRVQKSAIWMYACRLPAPVAICTSFLIEYTLMFISTVSCDNCAGGVLCGSFLALCYLGFIMYCSLYLPGPATRYLALGAFAAIVPTCFLGHGLVTRSELDKAVAAYGSDNNGLYPIEGLRPDVFNADVLSLQSISPQNFRFDLMGQAHEVLPLQDTTNARTAGKSEEGTYCAVPIVWDSWTVNDPVPFWYVCENNWQFFVNCKDAFEETYNDKDHYGYQNLRACLRAPMEVMKFWLDSGYYSSSDFAPRSSTNFNMTPSPSINNDQTVANATQQISSAKYRYSSEAFNRNAIDHKMPRRTLLLMPHGTRDLLHDSVNETVGTSPPSLVSSTFKMSTDAIEHDDTIPNALGSSFMNAPKPQSLSLPPPPVLYFYRMDFMSMDHQHEKLTQSAMSASSIQHHISLKVDALKIKLAPFQEPCCSAHKSAITERMLAVALGSLFACTVLQSAFMIFLSVLTKRWSK